MPGAGAGSSGSKPDQCGCGCNVAWCGAGGRCRRRDVLWLAVAQFLSAQAPPMASVLRQRPGTVAQDRCHGMMTKGPGTCFGPAWPRADPPTVLRSRATGCPLSGILPCAGDCRRWQRTGAPLPRPGLEGRCRPAVGLARQAYPARAALADPALQSARHRLPSPSSSPICHAAVAEGPEPTSGPGDVSISLELPHAPAIASPAGGDCPGMGGCRR